jgi:small subunit ribosomal protein S20
MPIIKSAKKKMRKDKTRTSHNKRIENNLKQLVKTMRRNPSADSLTPVFSSLDKAVKTKLIHANKAARLKSRLSKLAVAP